MTGAVAAICGLFGLLVGSFLNVVIWRVPRKESVVSPPSHCPGCDTQIAPHDNIPVLSWILLKGRCRHCGEPISFRYPFVELMTAVVWALVGLQYHDSWALPAYLFLSASLIALSAIDLDTYLLPTKIVRPTNIAGIVLLAGASLGESDWGAWVRAVLAGIVAYAFFMLLHVVKPNGMGMGDVRLSFGLGLNLGWLGWGYVAGGLFAGFLYGAVIGVGVMIAVGVKKGRKKHIPFGPFLAAGTMTFILWGAGILDWYKGLSGR
jgi:leader peptidase (prepilin peptidase)/N-methyltransferase